MKYYKYTKILQKKIKQLNLSDEDNNDLLICIYLYGGCSEDDCAKLFNFTVDSVIGFLKYEQIYDYKICSKCEKLKKRNDIEFKIFHTNQETTNICTKCKKLKDNQYTLEHSEQIKEYYEENKEEIKEKRQEYYKEYYLEHKETQKEYKKEYYNSLASEEWVQKLELYEEIKGNQIKCRYCGDWYIPTVQEVCNRLQGISNNDTGYIYCSNKCKEACPTFRRRLYPKGFKPASSREVNPVLRQLVFERDQYTCQKCFINKEDLNCPLHCHHITPYVDSPIEGNDPENCITLCKDCHKEVHEIPGCGYNELKCKEDELEYV